VSQDSFQIAFHIAALNDFDIMAADIQGAYLNAPLVKKEFIQYAVMSLVLSIVVKLQ
jgi:hypothetical protein